MILCMCWRKVIFALFRAPAPVVKLSIDVGTAKSIRDLGGSEADIPTLVEQVCTDQRHHVFYQLNACGC